MATYVVHTEDLEWQEAEGYPAGTLGKVLSDGSDGVPRTLLIKLPPGWSMDSHSHVHTEQHFVIEGSYQSLGRTYGPGTYTVVERGRTHGPFTTKTGAVILVTWFDVYR